MKHFLNLVLVITSALLVISCDGDQSKEERPVSDSSYTVINLPSSEKAVIKPEMNDTVVINTLTKEILTLLNNQDYETLADYFHPDLGVRFSPYAFINTGKDIHLKGEEFIEAIKSNKKFTWGHSDGSGDPILLTIPDYIKKYVYNTDFLNAEKKAFNKMIGSGNSLNNLNEIYPNALFTESYDPGKHEMAWSALRLVFQKKGEKFYLAGIVHDQWTI